VASAVAVAPLRGKEIPIPATPPTTSLLQDLVKGDHSAANRLAEQVYDDLRAIAARSMAKERTDHTLQTTALAHEAYLRLVDQKKVDWKGRAHFLGVAAGMIRRILVDHARKQNAQKRSPPGGCINLADADALTEEGAVDLLTLDEALTQLGKMNERHKNMVELRFFGGLTIKETAAVLGVSAQTVRNDWRIARAWLKGRLR